MQRARIFLGGLAAAVFFTVMPAGAFDLTVDGKPACRLVISPMATPSERLAAAELNAYVKKISGAELPVGTELAAERLHHQPGLRHEYDFNWKPEGDHSSSWLMSEASKQRQKAAGDDRLIVIGTPDSLSFLPAAIRKRLSESTSEEAFQIRSNGRNIYIIGRKAIGALYGTYAFLEEFLGVRWFYPGRLGEHCPQNPTVRLPEIDSFQEPDVPVRLLRGGAGPYHVYDATIWRARHKLQNRAVQALRWFEPGKCTAERSEFLNQALNTAQSTGGHTIWNQTVPNELFDQHPEYFVLKEGRRQLGSGTANGLQRCLANPEVFRRVSEFALNWCRDANHIFTICSADSTNSWCECEQCRAMGTCNGEFKITNLFHRFFTRVVDYVIERNPEARINVMFYLERAIAPDDPAIRYKGHNVVGVYCTCWPYSRCYAHHLTDASCELNAKCLQNMKAVLPLCPQWQTFEYLCNSDIPYAPVWKTTARDVKELAELGAVGYMDITHANKWRARWFSLYLAAKLLWNHELDPEQLLAEAMDLYYGPAAPAMKAYHALRLRLWENAPGHAFYGGPKRAAYCLTVPGAEEELKGFLGQARQLASGRQLVLERIALDAQYLEEFWKKPAEVLLQRNQGDRKIIAQRVMDKMVIDGELNENTWQAARPLSDFLQLKTEQPPTQENRLYLAYDADNLYIAFEAMNDKAWTEPIARMAEKDSSDIWRDDHIELQFYPPAGGSRFYHICVNTAGFLYDSSMIGTTSDKSFDSQAEVAVRKLKDRFVYELRLPLEPMQGSVAEDEVWGIFALRTAYNLQPPAVSETSSLDGNYPHRVMEFRQAVFGKE